MEFEKLIEEYNRLKKSDELLQSVWNELGPIRVERNDKISAGLHAKIEDHVLGDPKLNDYSKLARCRCCQTY